MFKYFFYKRYKNNILEEYMSNNDNNNTISTYINNNNYANKYIPKKTKLTRQTNTYYINDYYDEVYELNDFLFDFD